MFTIISYLFFAFVFYDINFLSNVWEWTKLGRFAFGLIALAVIVVDLVSIDSIIEFKKGASK